MESINQPIQQKSEGKTARPELSRGEPAEPAEGDDVMLSVRNLTVVANKTKLIEDISFEVKRGDVLAIIGPNGAGKTTLFRALLNMTPYQGEVIWKKDVRIGYVPQRTEIETDVPLTVMEFLRLHETANFNLEKAKEAIKSVLLPETILDSGLGEISVGQRQRILIAWSLLGKPEVLLFDEPTADIDIRGQESIYQLLHHLQDKYNLTVILISHDLNIVYKYAELVLCLNRQKICFGAPQDVLSPDQMQKLYGGEHAFYHHLDEHQH